MEDEDTPGDMVTQALDGNRAFNVEGTQQNYGDLGVTGYLEVGVTTSTRNLNVSNTATIYKDCWTMGNSYIQKNCLVNNMLRTDGPVYNYGNVTTQGTTAMLGGANVGNPYLYTPQQCVLNTYGGARVNGNLVVNGNLTVTGSLFITGDIVYSGRLINTNLYANPFFNP
jgi:carbonic anhydrase/acetyltransferase-like protein (isoleucine patch superfamily)